jgi:hypothetical protein
MHPWQSPVLAESYPGRTQSWQCQATKESSSGLVKSCQSPVQPWRSPVQSWQCLVRAVSSPGRVQSWQSPVLAESSPGIVQCWQSPDTTESSPDQSSPGRIQSCPGSVQSWPSLDPSQDGVLSWQDPVLTGLCRPTIRLSCVLSKRQLSRIHNYSPTPTPPTPASFCQLIHTQPIYDNFAAFLYQCFSLGPNEA